MKADVGEEKGGRLQRTLMSQPFRQTTRLQPATLHMPKTKYTYIHTSKSTAPVAEGQGRAKLPALASHSVN